MTIDVSAGADTKLIISPKVVILICVAVILSYAWFVTTFITKSEAGEIQKALADHITESTLYRLEADKNDVEDKAWTLEQLLIEPEQNTPGRREKLREYQKRIERKNEALRCIRADEKNCTTGQ